MADKSALNYFVIYLLSVPLYLFFNIEVTSSYLEGMDALLYHDSFTLSFFTSNDPMDNAIPSLHIGLPISLLIINRLHCYDLGIKIREWRHREFDIFVTINILIYLFSIQYLGIHWVIDIPSGIIIAIFTSYFVHKFQPLLRSVNLNGISSLIPKKRQLYAISIAMILCLTTITFGIIDGIGTNEENPNFRVGKGDVNLETIEVHSLSKPVAVEILNVGDTQIEILLIKRSYVEKYTDKGLFEWDKFATNGELMTLYPGQIVNFEVNTTSLFDAYLLLIRLSNSQDCEDCLVDLELGEVRITSNYVDDELLWTAILSSLPSFCIIGYVLGSINQKEI
tara:strand:- start:4670 stop:5680 length:1011 start_codon:yes stop_codon:yes gene_type:complete